jgi:uncharacterized protein (TIGR02246 family)
MGATLQWFSIWRGKRIESTRSSTLGLVVIGTILGSGGRNWLKEGTLMGSRFTFSRALVVLMAGLMGLTAGSCGRSRAASNGPLDLSNPDVAAIVQSAKDFEQWNKTGDVEHIAEVYSPDVIYMMQGMPNHEGRTVVAQAYKDFFSNNTAQVTVNVQEVRVFGDMAFDRATFTTLATPKGGGETAVIKGRLLEVLRKEAGKWKSYRVMAITE